MNTLFEIIKFATQSPGNFSATLAVIMFVGIAVTFILEAVADCLQVIFPVVRIERSIHNHYPEKKDVE